ncbi:KH domain-containing protein [Pseudanabaena sp. FACHB-1998]|uniref:KH domain-containing protein n=1 Tax=Pseudanabaena sp. FACHB-1998 TaxID=2692858 RepID=UPI001680DB60|nr:KH domain-containing protein [Pseudanabaena sp. FACHB-1998]MBD2177551.1 KH domain-containing protein [Pseudanabaena sp. FACHB-1998]
MPDYNALISFLLKPLLTHPDALRVDFESNSKSDRVWIRVAFDPEDRGRIFGKGGRTIQAVRTVVMTAAQEAGHSARFEVFDPTPHLSNDDHHHHSSEYSEDQQSQVERPRINVEKPKRREVNN